MAPSRSLVHLSTLLLSTSHRPCMGTSIHTVLRRYSSPFFPFYLYSFYRIVALDLHAGILRHRKTIRPQWCRCIPDRTTRLQGPQKRRGSGSVRSTWREGPIGIRVLFWCMFPIIQHPLWSRRGIDRLIFLLPPGFKSGLLPALSAPIRCPVPSPASSHPQSEQFPGYLPGKHPLSLCFYLLHIYHILGI